MEKKEKIMSAEDSFDSSDCSVFETNFVKWCDAEFKRLISKGRDINKFNALADPDINEGIIICADYTMKFNRDECVIDLVINGEEDSSIWDDVVDSVPARFAAFLTGDPKNFLIGKPENFLYRLSSNTSEKKEFYHFESTDDESGYLSPITKFNAIEDWKAENFDSFIGSIYNIF